MPYVRLKNADEDALKPLIAFHFIQFNSAIHVRTARYLLVNIKILKSSIVDLENSACNKYFLSVWIFVLVGGALCVAVNAKLFSWFTSKSDSRRSKNTRHKRRQFNLAYVVPFVPTAPSTAHAPNKQPTNGPTE